jgi:hypothetical protein
MLRSVASKVAWVGRTAAMVFGLALVLALVFGVTTTALSATGGNFLLGKRNVADAVSTLIKQGPGPALRLVVEDNQPPMRVNASAGKATNLNADKVDGQDAEALKPLLADVEGNGNLDTLANIRGVVSVEKLGTGLYEVTFDRDVHNCVRVGGVGASLNSVYFPDPDFIALQQVDGQVSTFNSTRGGDKIGVITNSPNGTRADRSFQLAVYC